MRFISTFILVVMATFGVVILTLPARADFRTSQAWFDSLPFDSRADLQGNLVLLAHYGGLVDARFGPGTYTALTSWQERAGINPNGVADQSQLELIDQMAAKAMSDLGMDLVDDLDGRLAIMLPMGLLPERRSSSGETRYQGIGGGFKVRTFWRDASEGSLDIQFQDAIAPRSGAVVSYSTLKPDLYVVSGTSGGKYFYELVHAAADGSAGFRFDYDSEFKEVGGVASVFAASYSAPTNSVAFVQDQGTSSTPTNAPLASPPDMPAIGTSQKNKQRSSIPDQSMGDGINLFGSFITFDQAPEVLALVGDIGPKTPLDLRRALNSMDNPSILALASDGGNVASALMVAYEVFEIGLSTTILPESGCYSACAFIFLAGKERLAEGQLGVHQVWGEDADASSAQSVVSDILEAFSEFQVRQEVTSAMLRTVPEEMYIFDQDELSLWKINTD